MSAAKKRAAPKKGAYHHGDLRAALVENALALIQEKGPEGFTLKEVARRAGVSHTAPYRHFADKRALFTAVATAGFAELHSRIAVALVEAPDDLRAKFLAGGQAYVRFALEHPAHFRVMFGAELDKSNATLASTAESAFSLLLAYISDAQSRGYIGAGDPMAIAMPVWAMHHGLASLASAGQLAEVKGRELRALIDESHEALLDGIRGGVRAPPRLKRR